MKKIKSRLVLNQTTFLWSMLIYVGRIKIHNFILWEIQNIFLP